MSHVHSFNGFSLFQKQGYGYGNQIYLKGSQSVLCCDSERLGGNLGRFSIFWGSAGPQPVRIFRSLAMAEFSVKSSLCLCGEGYLKLAQRSVL